MATPPSQDPATAAAGPSEPHDRSSHSSLLNKLRAGVLGANDGIVSVGGLVVGVAGASTNTGVLVVSGIASVVSGALSMAMGEYVSVSTQRDSERALIDRVREQLAADPDGERETLAASLKERGVPGDLAGELTDRLSAKDEMGAHLSLRYGIDEDMIVSPMAAAVSSLLAFTIGAMIPLLAILVSPVSLRVPITMLAVVLALALTGLVSSRLGESEQGRATVRTMVGGVLALLVGWAIGSLAGSVVGGADGAIG